MKNLIALWALLKNKNKSKKIYLPKTVGKYKLFRALDRNVLDKRFATGVYKHKSKKVFIKTWTGVQKNFDYFSLENELQMAKIIKKYISKSDQAKSITVPEVVDVIKSKNQLSVIYEYIDGKSIEKRSKNVQRKYIKNICQALENISEKISTQDRSMIPQRTVAWHIKIFLPKLLKSDISLYSKTLLSIQVLKSILFLAIHQSKKLVLAHGDLLPKNIMISKNKIYLIDFGHTSMAMPKYDLMYLAIQPNISELINIITPKSLQIASIYMEKILAAVSAVSTENIAMQKYFIDFVCA